MSELTSLVSKNRKRPYRNFINSLPAEETKKGYTYCLQEFLSYYNPNSNSNFLSITTLEDFLTLPVDKTEDMIIDYILYLRKQNLSSGYIGIHFWSLIHFYSLNDVRLNTVKLQKFLPEQKKKNVDRSYTHEEIKTILDNCDVRMKAVVSILASTGIRRGALPMLKLSHVEDRKNSEGQKVYKFTIYENTKDQYFTFCTPEATNSIDAYLDYRTRSGEKLTKATYLIREQFDVTDLESVRKQGRPISKKTLSNNLISIVGRAGLRKVNHEYTKREREPVPIAHGFRKFFTTQLVKSKVNPEIREMLLGHKIGLAGAYYKPTEDEMLEEYMKGVDNLTINPENRLRRKVEKLEVEKNQFDRLADR